jgi:diguanylate cyclase (GGDEF)-like protein
MGRRSIGTGGDRVRPAHERGSNVVRRDTATVQVRRKDLLGRSEFPPPPDEESDTDTAIGPLPDLKGETISELLDPDPTPIEREMKSASTEEHTGCEVTPYSFTLPAGPGALMASLTVVSGPAAGRVFPLDQKEVVIGRSPAAQIQIDDTAVSRGHARIVREGPGEYFVEDLASKNGTFLDGHPVQRARLFAGDRVHVGPHTALRFGLVGADEVALQRRLYASSTWDSLTGALTRAALFSILRTKIEHARETDKQLCLLMIDIDHFKRINDSFGHKAGDQVLRVMVERTRKLLPNEASLGRIGGEEFVVVLSDCHRGRAVALAERLRARLAALSIEVGNGSLSITVSIGVASLWEVPSRKPDDVLDLADRRLFAAKVAGRNRVHSTDG